MRGGVNEPCPTSLRALFASLEKMLSRKAEGPARRLLKPLPGLSQAVQGTRSLDAALLENEVVELGIVERASDSTIGRALPMKPGRGAPADYEYERSGSANLFMLFAPLEGGATSRWGPPQRHRLWLRLEGLGRHPPPARQDHRAHPGQTQIHSKASLYEALPAAEGRRLVERFEWHSQARQPA